MGGVAPPVPPASHFFRKTDPSAASIGLNRPPCSNGAAEAGIGSHSMSGRADGPLPDVQGMTGMDVKMDAQCVPQWNPFEGWQKDAADEANGSIRHPVTGREKFAGVEGPSNISRTFQFATMSAVPSPSTSGVRLTKAGQDVYVAEGPHQETTMGRAHFSGTEDLGGGLNLPKNGCTSPKSSEAPATSPNPKPSVRDSLNPQRHHQACQNIKTEKLPNPLERQKTASRVANPEVVPKTAGAVHHESNGCSHPIHQACRRKAEPSFSHRHIDQQSGMRNSPPVVVLLDDDEDEVELKTEETNHKKEHENGSAPGDFRYGWASAGSRNIAGTMVFNFGNDLPDGVHPDNEYEDSTEDGEDEFDVEEDDDVQGGEGEEEEDGEEQGDKEGNTSAGGGGGDDDDVQVLESDGRRRSAASAGTQGVGHSRGTASWQDYGGTGGGHPRGTSSSPVAKHFGGTAGSPGRPGSKGTQMRAEEDDSDVEADDVLQEEMRRNWEEAAMRKRMAKERTQRSSAQPATANGRAETAACASQRETAGYHGSAGFQGFGFAACPGAVAGNACTRGRAESESNSTGAGTTGRPAGIRANRVVYVLRPDGAIEEHVAGFSQVGLKRVRQVPVSGAGAGADQPATNGGRDCAEGDRAVPTSSQWQPAQGNGNDSRQATAKKEAALRSSSAGTSAAPSPRSAAMPGVDMRVDRPPRDVVAEGQAGANAVMPGGAHPGQGGQAGPGVAGEARQGEGQGEADELKGDRERMKESVEYQQAEQLEWVKRQEELQRQALEVQRLRKRKKAEQERVAEMESRQRLRLEEMRANQQKEEWNLERREQVRGQIQATLERLAASCYDMASLLGKLGMPVEGRTSPTPTEVQAVYKKALLKFHPDRASAFAKGDPRKQVEAEESFKIISRLKSSLPWVSPFHQSFFG